ncbi:hypothetical protein QO152_18715 [Pantoea allii]|uniref:hypothetical protein n=1 Tax=Pantoea allii TaxID=574096 RepID=UPI00397741F5
MERKTEIRKKILSNRFSRRDYRAFKTNMKIVKSRYHPDLTADLDLTESITQMAEDSTSLKGLVFTIVIMLIYSLRDFALMGLLFSFGLMLFVLAMIIWANAKQRNLPVMTELRLIKLAWRMRSILRVRAREEKARLKAEKKRKRAK